MDNLRGIGLMILAMAGFALEDALIKRAAGGLGLGLVVAVFGVGGTAIFAALTAAARQPVLSPDMLTRLMGLRALFEVTGRVGYFLAITQASLSSASVILQATPLVVTLGAVLFMGETVGWRRWSAMAVGFAGVLIVLRPGLEGFSATALFAVIGMVGFAGRDLATRAAPPALSNLQLAVLGFAVLIPTGLGMSLFDAPRQWPGAAQAGLLGAAVVTGCGAYYALTAAMRLGEVSLVAPFRYSRLVFALALAAGLFGESPDGPMLLGAALIVASGIYLITRGRRSGASRAEQDNG
ncbi:DMT family transporter [Actibacterium sp. MT2.3-13A]|uniref:DMT family transporter n=1 Tax=Actibacterium sp. MT2.3-13A TaxID=2828332 RepID=UPI001BAE4B2B|nr:DMT family transporter [Actibacterium sp. MT2.3-13A]